ncbi:hypothetical protein BDV10DRAFT_104323 [Aspergillus recurvatus]
MCSHEFTMGGLVSYALLAGFGFAWCPYTAFVFFAWIMGRGPPLHHSDVRIMATDLLLFARLS